MGIFLLAQAQTWVSLGLGVKIWEVKGQTKGQYDEQALIGWNFN
jgi:hypothetical protein